MKAGRDIVINKNELQSGIVRNKHSRLFVKRNSKATGGRLQYLILALLVIMSTSAPSHQLEGTAAADSQLKQLVHIATNNHARDITNPAAGEINASIDWRHAIREVPAYAYGVNSAANFIPAYSNDAVFMNNLEFVTQKKGFIRLHGWGMLGDSPEAWQDNGVWNSTKIKQALTPLVDKGYTVMINIPSGPQGEDDFQNPTAFAKFCADLVKIVNIDHDLGIQYWEIPNEREAGFTDSGLSVSKMATLIKTASRAMKAVDPSIKVGGPATAWVNVDYVSRLVTATYPKIDFVTLHTYSGDGANSLSNAYDIAQEATGYLAELRSRLNLTTGDNYLPIFLTEHNISYQGTPLIENAKGAVYNAIILTQSMQFGADASMYWNVAPYSDMSFFDGDAHFENAHIFEIFNQSFHGEMMNSQSGKPAKIIVYAVFDQASGKRAFGLINRTAQAQTVNLDFDGWLPSNLTWHLWDNDNEFSTVETSWQDINQGSFILSAYSVNLFIGQDDEDRPTPHPSGHFVPPILLQLLLSD